MAANVITPARNYFRLQFSLRMLLLLMAGVAAGLAIFRWPWSETTVEKDVTRTTTYHRGWNGKPLKHGLETSSNPFWEGPADAIYDEGVLRRSRAFDAQGLLASETLHYPQRGETLNRIFQINPERSVVAVSRTRDDGRQFRREWRTSTGQLLESIEYERKNDPQESRVVRWNDRPIAEATQELLNQLPPDQQDYWTQHGWLSNQHVSADLGDSTFLAGTLLHIDSADENPLVGIPLGRRVNYFLCPTSTTPNGPLLHELLAHSHARHQTLQCRFGILCVVSINAETAAPGDPTGALAVQFAAGTTASAAWLENVVPMEKLFASKTHRLHHFFGDTGIEIDASQLNEAAETKVNSPAEATFPFPIQSTWTDSAPRRTRRDTLGIFLWHHRLRVEQQGNKLIVLPRKEPRTQ